MRTHTRSAGRRRWVRVLLVGLSAVFLLLALGPFLIPVRSTGTETVFDLAYQDSRFIHVDAHAVHYRVTPFAGAHGESVPLIVLLHGFGASTYTWRAVQEPLAAFGDVVSYDRPGFGLTERPPAGSSLYTTDGQHRILETILDRFDRETAVLVGSSAGGTVAVSFALEFPRRVASLVLVSPAVYTGGGAPRIVQPVLRLPQLRRLGPILAGRIAGDAGDDFLRSSWYDPDRISEEVFVEYRRPTRVEGWEEGLWNLATAGARPDIAAGLGELALPALVVTGDTDRIVPTAESVRLAGELPEAALVVVPESGHLAHEETPRAFMDAVAEFFARWEIASEEEDEAP